MAHPARCGALRWNILVSSSQFLTRFVISAAKPEADAAAHQRVGRHVRRKGADQNPEASPLVLPRIQAAAHAESLGNRTVSRYVTPQIRVFLPSAPQPTRMRRFIRQPLCLRRVAVEPATGKSLVNIPVRRIGCVGVFDRLLFVVGRRPGGGKYNCHRLKCHDTPAAVEAMAVFLAHASKTAFVFDLGSPRLAKRSFLPTLSPRTRRKRSEGRTSSSPLSGRSPHGSPLGSPSPLRRSTSPAHTPVQVHPPTLSAALAHEIANPRGDRPSRTGSDVGSGDLLSPSRLSVSSSAGPASPRDEPTAAASLLSEFGFGEVDVEIDEAMLDDPDGGGQYGWFPVEAMASQGVRDELSGLTATDRWISETDLSAYPEDHAVAGPAECSLCLRSTTSGRERWVCMKNCECSFHETCLELWRCDGHNVCPNCSAPISLMKFYGRLLGKHMSPRPMTPENSGTLIREGCTAVVGAKLKCVVNLKINAAHLRFEGVSGALPSASSAIRVLERAHSSLPSLRRQVTLPFDSSEQSRTW